MIETFLGLAAFLALIHLWELLPDHEPTAI